MFVWIDRLFHSYIFSRTTTSQSDQLLTEESVGSGKYNALVNDPDLANAQNTALWELYPMRNHYCSQLVPHVKLLSQLKLTQIKPDERKIDDLIVYFDKLNSKKLHETGRMKRASLVSHDSLIKVKTKNL